MKVTAFIAAALVLCCGCPEASAISISDFLATAKNDYMIEHQKEKIDFLKSSSSNTPFFDRIELRTQTDEFELSRQTYSVRLYPNGWGETKAGKNLYEITLNSHETQQDLFLHQALRQRYGLVIGFLHSRAILELNRKLMVLYEDRVNVLKQSVNNIDFDFNDLIEAEDDCTRLQLELIGLENTQSRIENSIQMYIPEEVSIDFDPGTLAGIDLVQQTLEQSRTPAESDNVYLRDSRLRLELAKSRYNMEKAQSKRYISFLEASYDNERRHNTTEAFFVELGIRLPWINPDRLDINREKLRFLTEKAGSEELKRSLTDNLKTVSVDLKKLIGQYELLTESKKTGKAKSSIKTYMQLEGVDPLILLKIRESSLKSAIALEEIRYEIYAKYIELLDFSGRLSEKPLRNHISSTQESL